MSPSEPARILVVDDEAGMRQFLEVCLSRAGHDVDIATSGADAIRKLEDDESIDLVLTDSAMRGVDGMEVLRHAKGLPGAPIVLMMTAFGTAGTAVEAMKAGAYDYLLKPFEVAEIQLVVARALETRKLGAENRRLRDALRGVHTLDRMVGKSDAMQRVFELIRKIAPTRTNVLISGESGTGKELVARALHNLSGRPRDAFVPVNCGAIPHALMESELFGHRKGAFTGASADRSGVFEAARGGTLFLDEIGELALGMQVKLLRALQERKVRPVGASEEIEIDCRIVAATNRDLRAAIDAKEFREDLYFRLNVVQVVLAPLRHRREDIPALLERFVRRFSAEMDREIRGVSPEALRWFLDYDYPGNVRELENLVERAVALESSHEITSAHMPERRPAQAPSELPAGGLNLDSALEDLERGLIVTALERCGGVRKDTAELLQVSMRSLRYRIAKLGIGNDDGGS